MPESLDPTNYPDAGIQPLWLEAMKQELHALITNCTWTSVPRPKNRNVVFSKWILKLKHHIDGMIKIS